MKTIIILFGVSVLSVMSSPIGPMSAHLGGHKSASMRGEAYKVANMTPPGHYEVPSYDAHNEVKGNVGKVSERQMRMPDIALDSGCGAPSADVQG